MVTQQSETLLLDRMWVRELSHAEPCSKTVLFISAVTLLCNATVCMCTVVGGRRISADFASPCMCFPSVCLSGSLDYKVTEKSGISAPGVVKKHLLLHCQFILSPAPEILTTY